MMKRMAMVLVVIALAPLLMGGGVNPSCTTPPCPTPNSTGPAVGGTLVVDPHMDGITTVNFPGPVPGDKAKYGSIRFQKGGRTASAIFKLPLTFALGLGCDVTKTAERFGVDGGKPGFNGLRTWIHPLIVNQLLISLGINPATAGEPVITDFNNVVCTFDPENTSSSIPNPGILSTDIVVQFVK